MRIIRELPYFNIHTFTQEIEKKSPSISAAVTDCETTVRVQTESIRLHNKNGLA